jgi:hypothetical protein
MPRVARPCAERPAPPLWPPWLVAFWLWGGSMSPGGAVAAPREVEDPFDRIDEGRQPVSHIQHGGLTRQDVIAQRPQCYGQIAEQNLGGRVVLALAMAASHRDQPVGGGALGVEIIDGRALEEGIGGSHEGDFQGVRWTVGTCLIRNRKPDRRLYSRNSLARAPRFGAGGVECF